MSRQESILNTFWDEFGDLGNDEALLLLWARTNRRCGMAGLYKCGRRAILDNRLDDAARESALATLDRLGLVRYEQNVLWYVERYALLPHRGEKVARSAVADLREFPLEHPLRVAFLERYLGDPELGPDLRAALDHVALHPGKRSTAGRGTLSAAVKVAVIERDGPYCRYCGEGPADYGWQADFKGRQSPWISLQFDHVYPVAFGGADTVDNLVLACGPCNVRKGIHPAPPMRPAHPIAFPEPTALAVVGSAA